MDIKRIIHSFYFRMVLIGIIPITIIGIVIGYLSFLKVKEEAVFTGKKGLSDASARLDLTITTRTRNINNVMEAISEGLYLRMYIDQEESDYINFCKNYLNAFPEVKNIYIFKDKSLGYTTDFYFKNSGLYIPKNIYTDLSNNTHKVFLYNKIDPLNIDDASEDALFMGKAISNRLGHYYGCVMVELDAGNLGNMLVSKQRVYDDYTTIISIGVDDIIYTDNTLVTKDVIEDLRNNYMDGRRLFSFKSGGREYYCSAQDNGLTGWVVYTLAPTDYMFSQAAQLRNYIVLIVLVCVLIAAIYLLASARALAAPIIKLRDAMLEVRENNLGIRIENNRMDEIGELTDSFNLLLERIETLIDEVYTERIAQQNAQMEALQAQINPHFLYNTLDSINWMLITRDEMDISEIVVALGDLMKYSINKGNISVPLKEEFSNIKNFLLIYKNRMEDKLNYELILDKNVEEYVVPKLILQPLVENSIKHGYTDSNQVITIKVTAELKEKLVISIEDDGIGIDENRLEYVKYLIDEENISADNIGIRNVALRLKLIYDEDVSINVDSKVGQGTRITIVLPRESNLYEDNNC